MHIKSTHAFLNIRKFDNTHVFDVFLNKLNVFNNAEFAEQTCQGLISVYLRGNICKVNVISGCIYLFGINIGFVSVIFNLSF